MSAATHFRPVTARLPVDVFERLRQAAELEQPSISNMLRLIATRYLDEHHDAASIEQAHAAAEPDSAVPAAGTAGATA